MESITLVKPRTDNSMNDFLQVTMEKKKLDFSQNPHGTNHQPQTVVEIENIKLS